ncbi:VanZ family protein [Thalassobacillus pellis]|uniref:VanZ family protein n=1 Tax=Thalassobacillus pellis TaxID=748008 RepID=UPI001960A042|nr:VanZ family protein [Thalassobacillus pellis]MBM7551597.1 VanZ family protein [Thalassobacillus pellis]
MSGGDFLESLHLIEFAILYLLLVAALMANHKLSRMTSFLAALIAMTYGLVDEFHQLFVVGRSFTVIDLVKDWIGVLIAWLVVHGFHFRKIAKQEDVKDVSHIG